MANFPDADVLLGLLLKKDPRFYHHQGSHGLAAAIVVSLVTGLVAKRWRRDWIWWGLWGGGLYLSHLVLDLLVNDPSPPYGIQLLWPFSSSYFISPFTPLREFDYFDPAIGMIATMASFRNLATLLREVTLLAPFSGLAWYFAKRLEKRSISCDQPGHRDFSQP